MFAIKDQDNRREGARGLTRNHGGTARGLRRAAAGAVCAAAVALPLVGAVSAQAATTANPAYTTLKLVNGWTGYGSGLATPAVANINGIVHLKGAMWTTGTNADPFVLPAVLRPAKMVFIPVDLCSGNKGRLVIQPNGVVTVAAENGDFAQAQCFTSLDGASFAR